MIAQHMLADCYGVIFLNAVRFRLILHFRRWELFRGTWNAWVSPKIKSNTLFLERHFWDQFFFLPNRCQSNAQATQTNVIQELHVGLANSSSE